MMEKFEELAGSPFPEDPKEQLKQAALAVFCSWDAPKAAAYRQMNGIDESAGTAATIQMMVFGNSGGASGSGAFTRNPATGATLHEFSIQRAGRGHRGRVARDRE
jgi:pyruvate,orthophosphate dikinase